IDGAARPFLVNADACLPRDLTPNRNPGNFLDMNGRAANFQPVSVSVWLKTLWNQVLFPGQRVEIEPWRWTSCLILFALSAALLYPRLSFYLFEPDEGRYAQIPREMLTRGDWIVPWLQSEPYLDKPPLFYWLVMASFAAFGFHDWAARLVPALAVQFTVLA